MQVVITAVRLYNTYVVLCVWEGLALPHIGSASRPSFQDSRDTSDILGVAAPSLCCFIFSCGKA